VRAHAGHSARTTPSHSFSFTLQMNSTAQAGPVVVKRSLGGADTLAGNTYSQENLCGFTQTRGRSHVHDFHNLPVPTTVVNRASNTWEHEATVFRGPCAVNARSSTIARRLPLGSPCALPRKTQSSATAPRPPTGHCRRSHSAMQSQRTSLHCADSPLPLCLSRSRASLW